MVLDPLVAEKPTTNKQHVAPYNWQMAEFQKFFSLSNVLIDVSLVCLDALPRVLILFKRINV